MRAGHHTRRSEIHNRNSGFERMQAERFSIAIPDDVIDDLRRRLRNTRWPSDLNNDDWSYGVNGDYLRSLVDYWMNDFDWRAQERAINRFDHFRATVDGVPVHFIFKAGKGERRIPLILSHGWPWTFWDYHELIDPLTDPLGHGGAITDAFDVIVPSLPGFGFSVPLTRAGINCWYTADLWHTLMTGHLGYSKYAAQGGDWGAIITSQLAHKYAQSLYGIHVSMPVWPGVFGNPRCFDVLGPILPNVAPEQAAGMMAAERRIASHITTHILDPQTLAYGMHDSPVGQLAWLLERWRSWSDCGGDIETRFSRDHMLTNATIYWVTQSFGTTARYYAETERNPWRASHGRTPVFEAPAGVSLFRGDGTAILPEANLAHYNLHYLKDHPCGGHFAPAEEPLALVTDIRETFRRLR